VHPDAGLWVEDRGNGFFYGHCDVHEYLSTRRRTPELAAEAVRHHVQKLERSARAGGLVVPPRRSLNIEVRRSGETSDGQAPSE
jgi:hypothetical protein